MLFPLMVSKYPNIKVVWVDAHTDIHSPETSHTGNCHGMPVHFMNELSKTRMSTLKLSNLCYYGIRDLDQAETDVVVKNNIKNYTTEDIKSNRGGIINDIEEWIGDSPVHLSIDVDAPDPTYFPSTGFCAGDGLGIDDIVLLCKRIKGKNLVSMDLTEFNPKLGTKEDVVKSMYNAGSIMDTLI